jgi:hypothetical protein
MLTDRQAFKCSSRLTDALIVDKHALWNTGRRIDRHTDKSLTCSSWMTCNTDDKQTRLQNTVDICRLADRHSHELFKLTDALTYDNQTRQKTRVKNMLTDRQAFRGSFWLTCSHC